MMTQTSPPATASHPSNPLNQIPIICNISRFAIRQWSDISLVARVTSAWLEALEFYSGVPYDALMTAREIQSVRFLHHMVKVTAKTPEGNTRSTTTRTMMWTVPGEAEDHHKRTIVGRPAAPTTSSTAVAPACSWIFRGFWSALIATKKYTTTHEQNPAGVGWQQQQQQQQRDRILNGQLPPPAHDTVRYGTHFEPGVYGPVPLVTAIEVGNSTAAKMLLDAGASPFKAVDTRGKKMLHLLASHAMSDVLALLLRDDKDHHHHHPSPLQEFRQQKRDLINQRDAAEGAAPLHFAAWRGSLLCCSLLLENGADPKLRDNRGNTPFALAATYNNAHVLQALYWSDDDKNDENEERRARPTYSAAARSLPSSASSSSENAVNCVFPDGFQVLHKAVFMGCTESVVELIRLGADPNAEARTRVAAYHTPQITTPLILAAQNMNASVIRALVKNGADRKQKDQDGNTARDVFVNSSRWVETGLAGPKRKRCHLPDEVIAEICELLK